MLLSERSSSLIPSTNCLPACSSVPSNMSPTKPPELTILSLFWNVWWISCTCMWGDVQAHSPAHQDPLWHGPHRLNQVVPWTFVLATASCQRFPWTSHPVPTSLSSCTSFHLSSPFGPIPHLKNFLKSLPVLLTHTTTIHNSLCHCFSLMALSTCEFPWRFSEKKVPGSQGTFSKCWGELWGKDSHADECGNVGRVPGQPWSTVCTDSWCQPGHHSLSCSSFPTFPPSVWQTPVPSSLVHILCTRHSAGRPCRQVGESWVCLQRTGALVEELEQIPKRISVYTNV